MTSKATAPGLVERAERRGLAVTTAVAEAQQHQVLRDYFVNMHALMSKPLEDFRGDNISH